MSDTPHTTGTEQPTMYSVENVQRDFPILAETFYGKRLVYLDNANTSHKPQRVIDATNAFYSRENSNIHRGVYALSVQATDMYEAAREKVRRFMGAADANEIIFVRGTTEGINLVAQTWGRQNIGKDDEIVISAMEHHSNIVPWQILCEQTGAKLRIAPMSIEGDIEIQHYKELFNEKTKLAAMTHVSNAIGTVNPVADMIKIAHDNGAVVLVDGAQAAPHLPMDVVQLDADFYAVSSHKMYGPMGIGALYGKMALLESMPPYQGGGDMIESVTFEKTTYNSVPHKFEAGTPNVAGVIGLGATIDYLETIGMENVLKHEEDIVEYAVSRLSAMEGVKLIGVPQQRASVVSFVLDGIHPHDVGTILDQDAIAIRAGHHCSQPLMDFYKVPATNRASFGIYNSREDVDALIAGIEKVQSVFA
jgi:cysteine desulfurase/selenocysteine lyase